MPRIPRTCVKLIVLVLAALFFSSCNGMYGGKSSYSSSMSQRQLAVTPIAGTVRAGDTQQYSAIVPASASQGCGNLGVNQTHSGITTGTSNPCAPTVGATNASVTWFINGVRGGNSKNGRIDDQGLYRAPASVPNPNEVSVTATSVANPSASVTVPLTLENSTPVVTSVQPSNIPVGSFTLTVSGIAFAPGAQVVFAGQILPTSYRSATQLVATGMASSSEVGRVQVLVENPNPGSSTSTSAPIVQVISAPSATSASTDISQADVRVDVSESVSETGGDDLAAAKNIYASASAPESVGGLDPDWVLLSSQFAMKRMRIINGLDDCALDSGGHLTGCSRLNGGLAQVQKRGLIPHIIVGQRAPGFIGGNPLQWGASQWATYDALCNAIVNYITNQYGGSGFSQVVLEVGNEVESTKDPGDLWLTTSPNVPPGDPSRFTQYDTVYGHWAKAVSLVSQQNPAKKIRIAGPAAGFWTVAPGLSWPNQIIQKYAAEGVKLDIVSLHQYGGNVDNLATNGQSLRATLNANGNSKAEIWVTEWGASAAEDSYFGAINASHEAAAWAINFLLQALKGTITGGSFLLVRDNFGTDTAGFSSIMDYPTWNHVENNTEYPKAIANAFSMVDLMKGTRRLVALNPNKPDIRGFASSDSSSASVIVANYNYLFANKNYSDRSNNETVTVGFEHLPISGPVTVDRYLIDAQTSNPNYWVAAGKPPPSVQATRLQKVESFSATSTGGTLVLPARTLGPSAVSLWTVRQ